MSSEHEGSSSRGGSLEDIRVDDIEVESQLSYALRQVRGRWKALGATVAAAVTTYAVYWVDVVSGEAGGLTVDVWVFGLLTVALIIYSAVMLYGDIELD